MRNRGKFIISLLWFISIVLISLAARSPLLFFILLLLYLDKTLLSMVEIVWYFGIELLTIPIILGGIGYGPIFGFLLGFIIDKVFDVLRILVAPPVTTRVTPLVPTFGSLILGIIGALAGVFGYFIPFVDLVLYLTIIKNVMFVFKE
ncbi:MAG: hypothetical protein J7K98_02880, partial [Candidatus Aenigmarchaeota archaeon]|nr:hypothetical protein [Candidatus Aenigmarchaeota archaeon]